MQEAEQLDAATRPQLRADKQARVRSVRSLRIKYY